MMKAKKFFPSFKRQGALLGAMAVLAGGFAVAGPGAPEAEAYKGHEDGRTGIVWGVGQDGSYMVPLASGGEKQGWCIDPGAAYPKQKGYGPTKYGNPVPWKTTLNNVDKKKLAIALIIGQGIENGAINPQTMGIIDNINGLIRDIRNGAGATSDFLKGLPVPPEFVAGLKAQADQLKRDLPDKPIPKDVDQLAAGVSGVVHEVGSRDRSASRPPYTKPWNPNRLAKGGPKDVYSLIMRYSNLIPDQLLPSINFSIRQNAAKPTRQRMILMDDIKIDFGKTFTIPNFPPPPNTPPTPPSTTPRNDDTPVSSSSEQSSTTPGEKTRSTTPEVTPTPSRSEEEPTPEIRTNAGTKASNVVEQGKTIVDTVTYKNLEKGEKYRLTGETVDKATGKKDGNKGEKEFTPETSNGRIDVPIKLEKAESEKLVVFETLEKEVDGKWKKVAEHADVKDEAQTVGRLRRTPQIGTSAESSTGNSIQSGTTVRDTVRFQGLIPGKQYRLEAKLMCKATGQDTGASQTHTFTPQSENGQTVVENIAVTNPDCLEQVVFEKLYDENGYLVASHEDLNDAAQTFGGEQPAKKKKKTPTPEKPMPVEKPNGPIAQANANANAKPAPAQVVPLGAPAPGGVGGPAGGGGGGAAPRQTIGSVPSGEHVNYGETIFNR